MKILLENANVVLPNSVAENTSVLIENGRIKSLAETHDADKTINLQDLTLFAGFIDIHNHGAIGVDVNNADVQNLLKVGGFLARHGVTAWLPTFVPDSDENYAKVIGEIEKVIENQADEAIARIVGVHYEGVFANPKMSGALRPQFFKTFQKNEIDELPRLKTGVHLTTLAPETENGIELIRELVKQNWICSIGHTNADLLTLNAAKSAGATHLTHFFNAMSGLHHREVGVVGFGLTNTDVTFDIIADKIHVHPQMLEFASRAKGTEKVSLISDCVAPTGLGDGEYEIWGEKISVVNGKTRNERGTIAGSVITMLDALRNMLALGFSKVEVSKMASANPSKLIGIDHECGSIEAGKRADFVALDESGNIKLTIIGGNIVE